MNCHGVHDRLLELIAGDLSPDEAREMLEHTEGCEDCAAVLAVEEELQSLRSEGVAERVPEELVASMWPRVRAELAPRSRRRSWPRPWPGRRFARGAIAATLAAVLLGGGFLWGRAVGPDDPRSVPAPVPVVGESARSAARALRSAEVLTALDRLPDRATLLSAPRTRELLERSRPLRSWVETSDLTLDLSDGIQVEELRRALVVMPRGDGGVLPASLRPAEIRRWLERRV